MNNDNTFHPSKEQSAIRLLILIYTCGKLNKKQLPYIESEKKLQALDFWIRNPFYLANEFISKWKNTNSPEYLNTAKDIIENGEPDIRRHSMIRFWYGAYEPKDDSLSFLKAYDLIEIKRNIDKKSLKVNSTKYQLTNKGVEVAEKTKTDPHLKWYHERSELIKKIAKDKTGNALKKQQYEQIEYKNTQIGQTIPSIKERVLHELATIEGAQDE